MDCIRLCCSLCLLENDPEIISPDVLADDREKFEASGDHKYIDKAHRHGKVGWDVGKHIEVIPITGVRTWPWCGPGFGWWCLGLYPGEGARCIGRPWRSCGAGLGEDEAMISMREDALKTTIDGLANIETACRLRGLAGLLDLNRVLQHFFSRFLSELYGLSLVELDRIQPNFPAIDLGDKDGRQCFQVTSDKSGEKVQATLDKYVEKRLYEQYGPIRILVIGERQKEYRSLRVPDAIRFDTDTDVLGTAELVKYVETLDTPALEKLAEIVRTELRCGDHMGSSLPPKLDSGEDKGPPIYQFGNVKTLPLNVIRFVTLEPLRAFGSARAEITYRSPAYDPPFYAVDSKWLERIGKDASAALEMTNGWREHLAQFQYFVQFQDDTGQRLVSRLHSHTELLSLLCDARLGIDSTVLWAVFHSTQDFLTIHSEYRADRDRATHYQQHASHLEETWQTLSAKDSEAGWLIKRITKVIEVKAGMWSAMPPMGTRN